MNNKKFLRVFSVFVLAFFSFGVLALVWNTISKDISLTDSSADTIKVVCGNLDTNLNNVLDIADYNEMKKLVGNGCTDKASNSYCGPRDINGDGMIDLTDMTLFSKRFNKPDCGL